MARRRKSQYELSGKDHDFVTKVYRRISEAAKATHDDREQARESLAFLRPGGQWSESIKALRMRERRPVMEVPLLSPYIDQLVNEMRENRPSPTVNPTGGGATKEAAEIMQGLIRHTMYISDGDVAIDTAFEHMVKCGRGFMRVITEYQNPYTRNQKVSIKRIMDPIDSVFLDPTAECPVGSDSEWGAIITWVTRESYEKDYPNSELAKCGDFGDVQVAVPDWAGDDGVAIVEYFEKVLKDVPVVATPDGVIREEDIPEAMLAQTQGMERWVAKVPEVKWYKVNATEILETTDWPGKYIPIVPVYGNEDYFEGKLIHTSITQRAKDSVRFYNLWKSVMAEVVARTPRTQWLAPQGAIINKKAWMTSDQEPVSVLEYANTLDGQPLAAPPTRPSLEAPIMALQQMAMGAEQDVKASTGMYDPVRGLNEAGQSGVAIRQLQRQGQVVNFHLTDNLARSIRLLGRILVDLEPKIRDVPQVVRIVKPDGREDMVPINQEFKDENGMLKLYNLGLGEYDVTVSTGPSYQTKRQEQLALLSEAMQSPMGQLIAMKAPDVWAGLLDFEIAGELRDRLTPPEFKEGQKEIPPEVQQQIQQGMQQMQQMQQAIQQLQQENQQLKQGQEVKMQTAQMDMQLEGQKAQANMALEAEKVQMDAQLAIQKAQIDAQTKIETAKIQAEADIIIARMRGHMELQGQIASTAVNNAMQTGASGVEIEMGGENGEGEYDNGVGNNAGMED